MNTNVPGLVKICVKEFPLYIVYTHVILNPVAVARTVVPLVVYTTDPVIPVSTTGGSVTVPDEQLANIPVVAVAVTDPVLPAVVCKAKVNDPGLVNVYDNELSLSLLLLANTPAILNPVAIADIWLPVHILYSTIPVILTPESISVSFIVYICELLQGESVFGSMSVNLKR